MLKEDLKPMKVESKIQQLDSTAMSKRKNLQLRQQLKLKCVMFSAHLCCTWEEAQKAVLCIQVK